MVVKFTKGNCAGKLVKFTKVGVVIVFVNFTMILYKYTKKNNIKKLKIF